MSVEEELRAELAEVREKLVEARKQVNYRQSRLTRSYKKNDELRDKVKQAERERDDARARAERIAGRGPRSKTGRRLPTPLSELEMARVHLSDLVDRIVTEARRQSHPAAATGLRLAAREVEKVSKRLGAEERAA